jgi:hypothetical protein
MADKLPPKKGPHMATNTAPVRPKSAKDELLESFGELIDIASRNLTHKEFMKVTQKAKATLKGAVAAHSRRRGTA